MAGRPCVNLIEQEVVPNKPVYSSVYSSVYPCGERVGSHPQKVSGHMITGRVEYHHSVAHVSLPDFESEIAVRHLEECHVHPVLPQRFVAIPSPRRRIHSTRSCRMGMRALPFVIPLLEPAGHFVFCPSITSAGSIGTSSPRTTISATSGNAIAAMSASSACITYSCRLRGFSIIAHFACAKDL